MFLPLFFIPEAECCFQLVEIGGQKVRSGGGQLLAAAIAVENADGLKAVGVRPVYVVAAVADHDGVSRHAGRMSAVRTTLALSALDLSSRQEPQMRSK